jgi:hypothetical protein
MSSIGFWKLRIKNTAINIENSTTKKVSQKNMPKTFLVSAPLHLCMLMAFARYEREEMEISA